jgi:hypothetical protein
MDLIAHATARLARADGLAAIIGAAYDAFEDMLPVIEQQQDPAGGAFTAFVMAAAYAASGRDALLFAPSLPPASPSHPDGSGDPRPALETAVGLTQLARLLTERLGQAATMATDDADRRACADGAFQASTLAALLARTTGP